MRENRPKDRINFLKVYIIKSLIYNRKWTNKGTKSDESINNIQCL